MSEKISLILDIDNKSGKAVLKDLDQSFKELTKSMTKNAKESNKEMETSLKAVKTLGIGTAKVVATATAAAFVGLGVGLKSVMDSFIPFESALANVSTLGNYTTETMLEFRDSLIALPSELGTTTELTKGLYQALSAGVKPAEGINFITEAAIAAKAGLTDTFTAVDAGTTVLNAFGMETKRAKDVYDLMFTTVKEGKTTFEELASSVGKISPIASAAGVSVKEMHAALATLTKGGFKTSEAAARLTTAIGTIVKPSEEAKKMSDSLGLSFNSQALKANGLHGFLMKVKEATGGNIDKMALLFGGMESLSVILALTGKQSGEYADILERMGGVSGATQEAFEKQTKALGASGEAFKSLIDKVKLLIGIALAPYIKKVLDKMTGWLKVNKDLLAQKIPEMVIGIGRAIQTVIKIIGVIHQSFLTLKLIAEGALVGISGAIKFLTGAIRILLTPLDYLFKGLVALGTMEANPFDTLEKAVSDFSASSVEGAKETIKEMNNVNESYSKAEETVRAFTDELHKMSVKEQTDAMARDTSKATKSMIGSSKEMVSNMGNDMDFIDGRWQKIVTTINTPLEVGVDVKQALTNLQAVKTSMAQIKDKTIRVNVKHTGTGSTKKPLTDKIKEIKDCYETIPTESTFDVDVNPALESLDNVMKKTQDVINNLRYSLAEAIYAGRTAQTRPKSFKSWADALRYNIAEKKEKQRLYGELVRIDKEKSEGTSKFGDTPSWASSFATGTGEKGLPYTGLFYGHEGEIVKSPEESKKERNGGSGNTFNITFSPTVMTGDNAAMRQAALVFRDELKTLDHRWA